MALTLLRGGKSNYPYAVARVQAKRSKLVPERDYPKLLKMDVAEITRFIEESAYRREVDELAPRFKGLDLLEAALTVNEERTFQSVRGMLTGPGGQVVDLYLSRFLVEDLKTVLRGKVAGATRDELLREMLLEDTATFDLFQPLLADDVRTPEEVVATLDRLGGHARPWAKALQHVAPGAPLSAYEDALDRAQHSGLIEALEASRQEGAPQVLEFVRREIDALNLVNAARWVHAGAEGDFSPYVLPGGKTLKVAQVVALSRSKGLDAFAEQVQDHPWHAAVKDALDAARSTGRLATFQAAVQRAVLADLDRLSHSHPLSIIPILIFLVRKHREVVTIRAIARGKAAGLSEARLQELIV